MEFIYFGGHGPTLATPIVVVGATSRYLVLSTTFTTKTHSF